jgi:hypothetical protein
MTRSARRLTATVMAWVLGITALHLWLNFDWAAFMNDRLPESQRRLYVGYIPVT